MGHMVSHGKKDTTWQPTRKCHLCLPTKLRSAISVGSFAQIGVTLGLCLHRGSSKIRDADVMFHERVTVVLRVGLLSAELQRQETQDEPLFRKYTIALPTLLVLL